jgi:hypothetical protein
VPTYASERENVSESELSKSQLKIERLQAKMKSWQASFSGSPAQDYLQSRGIDAATAKAFGCGYAEAWEHWKKDGEWQLRGTDRRVVFPVHDSDGNVIAFHGRAIDEKFIDSPKISKGDKSQGLFQTPNALENNIVTIVEGPVDAMALHQCGLPAAALIGTSAGDWLSSALAFRNVFVGMDADESGDEGSETLISVLRSRGSRAVRLRPTDCNDWGEFLEKFGRDALRDFIEQQTAEAFPDYQPLSQPEAVPEDFVIEDLFSAGNESGQRVIDYLLVAAASRADDFLLNMPTVKAYKTELALVRGIAKNSHGELSDESLRILTETYIAAHLRSEDVSDQWTGGDVPLLYLTLRLNGERLESVTCNQIQSWVIREHWLRQTPEAEIDIMNL